MWFQITDPAAPQDVAAVVDAARGAAPRCSDTVVVAVDGPSGSGKTTLAAGIAEILGCPVVHMDEIFPGWDGLAEAVGLVTSQVLEPVAQGRAAAYRVWDWAQDRWGAVVTVPPSRFLILEGCGSCVLPAGGYAAVRVWVEAPLEVRRWRGIERDGEPYRVNWERWATQERALYAADRTRERADLIIDTTPRPGPGLSGPA